ncbi:MAG: hypothetical protein DI556_08895 [Rhodovulum sulfidophilum]|uniref:DUF1275 domain-containing protein n=1 Tax=Rhodovulum sulfidophilum TaxID=35806 RepID=A0A2W5NHG8_RHOSU|nr:MAG: hypothetical protein DI556_08895 [Rhodovulum sulfidophilum]
MKPAPVLAFNAGYVDTLGFLSLHGLFTAHVTGNFVTIGAALALGSSGIVTKLLALPVFCVVVMGTRLAGRALAARHFPDLRLLLWAKIALLTLAAGAALAHGPFSDADAPWAMLTGLALVAAMAIQNATHRTHMSADAPSTLMTGTTTQIMIDLVDLARPRSEEARAVAGGRLKRLSLSLAGFALGCAVAAGGYLALGMASFLLPPLVAVLGLAAVEAQVRSGATAA